LLKWKTIISSRKEKENKIVDGLGIETMLPVLQVRSGAKEISVRVVYFSSIEHSHLNVLAMIALAGDACRAAKQLLYLSILW
jgi:hypothetical protein